MQSPTVSDYRAGARAARQLVCDATGTAADRREQLRRLAHEIASGSSVWSDTAFGEGFVAYVQRHTGAIAVPAQRQPSAD
ncbi:hypothetical protein [Nocardioides jejuensis]|uniref:Uncharacterized protein n=1 Tax=Nocardioides jejuensis TaxID=2502782 RepID=A0A4R1CI98_9ACTN|nr:hypothetical protein [Nocardioides jejuensis]TCJ31040.1 hypothetical protein EPD65_00235 [Nocardioides jejuensis]